MTAATVLRIAVIAELVLIPIALGVSYWTQSLLPPELLEIEGNQQSYFTNFKPAQPVVWALIAVGVVLTGLGIATVVGLLKLRRWGAWLYLAGVVLALPLYFLTGYGVYHSLDQMVTHLCTLVTGLILGLAFFSNAIPWKTQALPPNCGWGTPEN